MVRNFWISLVVLVVFCIVKGHASDLACQYTENATNPVEIHGAFSKATGELITTNLTTTALVNDGYKARFSVLNNYDVPITIHLTFDYGGYRMGELHQRRYDQIVNISARDSTQIQIEMPYHKDLFIYQNTLKYSFQDNAWTEARYEKTNVTYESCKRCLGITCLNDGDICELDAECGGGHCVEGRCNNNETCYNLDCTCPTGEIQCPENDACVPERRLGDGIRPQCTERECISGYVNDSTGKCAKSPEAAKEEEALFLGGTLAIVLAAALAVVYIWAKKSGETRVRIEKERTRQLDLEMKKLRIELDRLQKIKELKDLPEKERQKLEREIKGVERKRDELIRIQKEYNEEQAKPLYYPKWTSMELCLKDGYPCFKSGVPLHRWIAEKEIFNKFPKFFERTYPGVRFGKLEVHHIDTDRFNPDPDNLVIISKEEHGRILHRLIPRKDRKKGIDELRKLGIRAPHITELE